MEAAAEQTGEHLQNLNIQDQAATEGPKPTVVLVIGEHARSHAANCCLCCLLHCQDTVQAAMEAMLGRGAPLQLGCALPRPAACRPAALPPPNAPPTPCSDTSGMAGSGKTTFMQRLNAHLHSRGEPGYIINLDPAVTQLPYGAHVDIRDTVNYKNVMQQYGLGPNGAILTSLNLFATRFDQVGVGGRSGVGGGGMRQQKPAAGTGWNRRLGGATRRSVAELN